jgi:hypothetical protein
MVGLFRRSWDVAGCSGGDASPEEQPETEKTRVLHSVEGLKRG